jgi:hypothetical protein
MAQLKVLKLVLLVGDSILLIFAWPRLAGGSMPNFLFAKLLNLYA